MKWTERLEICPGAFELKIRADYVYDIVRGSNLLDHFRRDRSHARWLFLPRLAFEAMPNLRSATPFPINAEQLVRYLKRSRGVPSRCPAMSTWNSSVSVRFAGNDDVLDRFGAADGRNGPCG